MGEMIRFPHGWSEKDLHKRLLCDDSKHDKYFDLLKDREKMYEFFFSKMKEMGISIDIKEDNGDVHLHTEKLEN